MVARWDRRHLDREHQQRKADREHVVAERLEARRILGSFVTQLHRVILLALGPGRANVRTRQLIRYKSGFLAYNDYLIVSGDSDEHYGR